MFTGIFPEYSLNEITWCFTGCPFEWLNYRDKCYFFSKDLHSFDDAKATCESTSASLLIINDMEEQVTNYGSQRMKYSEIIMHWKERLSLLCNVWGNFSVVTQCFLCPHATSEMAEEADHWKGLLLDGSDRQGGGERLALAGRDWTCFHVSINSENTFIIGNILFCVKVGAVPGMDILFQSCAKYCFPITTTRVQEYHFQIKR